MAGLGAKDILRNITALEQLIEEINFQRAKEMRQCLMSKDSDTSFVIVHGTTYWTDLFVRHFLFQTDRSTDADDLLFFIRKKQIRGSRYIPKYQTEVEVYRKDSRKLPIGDPDIDWEETVYLNLIIHQFDYTLTLAVCTRTSPKELQVLKRHSQKVYASPSRRRMDSKGEVEEMTYPNVCFHVDNFDEVFADMLVRDGEMVCVELVAADHGGSRQAVIFLGSIRYDALKRVYDTRASLSSKVAQRMMLSLFSGGASQRIEFVRMKGPQGKGHAEMAVSKPKGSGVETPTSEPGVSLTDLWDSDWEDEPEDRFLYRHQRRLSDPSANFNTFINSGWVSKAEGKSRSENEGLDNFANGLCEIESGDVRDALCSCRCCSIVACRMYKTEDSNHGSPDGVCCKCNHLHGKENLLTSSIQSANNENEKVSKNDPEYLSQNQYCSEITYHFESNLKYTDKAFDALDPTEMMEIKNQFSLNSDLKGETETSESHLDADFFTNDSASKSKDSYLAPSKCECKSGYVKNKSHVKFFSMKNKHKAPGSAIRVNDSNKSSPSLASHKEYMPVCSSSELAVEKQPAHNIKLKRNDFFGSDKYKSHHFKPIFYQSVVLNRRIINSIYESNCQKRKLTKSASTNDFEDVKACFRKKILIPFRMTKDGTKVFFPCKIKLDDGAYNPLWTSKGFTQTFHFWKESRRAQSVPLNAYLTYVTLPWFTIITDILDHRTEPILTF